MRLGRFFIDKSLMHAAVCVREIAMYYRSTPKVSSKYQSVTRHDDDEYGANIIDSVANMRIRSQFHYHFCQYVLIRTHKCGVLIRKYGANVIIIIANPVS